MPLLKHFVCFVISLLLIPCSGYGEKKPDIPEALKPWKEWVLYGKEYYTCPRAYNASDEFFCVWPEILDLDFTASGGVFKQIVTVFSPSPVPLPGDRVLWPLSVLVDGNATPILSSNGTPSVYLETGSHTLSGKFGWNTLPSFFPVPEHTGLVSLRVNGTMQVSPAIDTENRLWISKKSLDENPPETKEMNSVNVSLYRLVDDGNPMVIETRMELSVSGDKRREKLNLFLPHPAAVVSLTSPLPLKLMEDGTLWVDVKSGTYAITISSVINAPVSELGPLKTLYGEELWAFKSRPDMRTTRIEGVQAIDPMQSNLPGEWKKYSSYRITDGSKITMHEIQRGCPEQDTDSLFLSRELWLDFKGHGATIRDLLSGTLGKRRYLSMDDRSYTLGRMSLDGKDRLITRLGDLAQGLELDRGPVSLEAVSRLTHLESGKSVNLGWDCDYQSADVTVNLPPGWRLLGVRGGNVNSGDTWLNQWSMLDFFLILIVCYAAIRLWNIPWGVLFFTGLILTCHEKATPFYLFVFLILLVALIRFKTGPHTPPSPGVTRFKKLVLSALVIYSAFFSVVQIRSALYPQLESPGGFTLGYGSSSPEPAMMMAPPEPFPESESRIMAVMDEEAPMEKMMPIPRAPVPHKKKYTLSSENIITQTGPAIPTWDFKRITIDLGRVPSSHSLGLYLMSPAHNSFFSIIRVLLVMVMILRFIPVRFRDRLRHKNKHATPVCLALVSAITGICLMGPARAHADIPSPQLLSELETRLTKAADCYPQCASLSEVSISLPDANGKNDKQFIVIDFTVNAALKTAMPLPSGLGSWELYDMRLDEAPHLAVMRDNRSQWTLIPQGVHQISLRGMAVGQSSFRFSFPLKPALVRVHGKDWDIIGLDQNMQTENSLIATRKASVPEQSTIPADDATLESPEKPLADHVTVRRDVSCDREWTLTTTVERFPGTDDQKSVMIALPLLKDEKVRTDLPGLNLNETTAQVSLAPGVHRLSWISSLPITPTLDLSVPLSASWSEIWSLKLSSRWHLTSNGPPMVCPDSGEHSFWYPWPGEHLNLSFTQMEPAAGDYFTIDSASIDYYIEKGSNRIVLTFSLRTSQGRNYTIPTPKDCMVKTILINGRSMPFSGSPDTIDIPLSPGPQTIRIEWNQANTWNTSFLERFIKPDIIAFPPIDMGVDAANVDMTMHLPDRSWIIYTHGPYLGPALLTWGLCGLILMGALILGRMPISPLSSRTWTILGLGLLSMSLPQILCVVGWFLVMELRKNTSPVSPLLFNLMQVFLMAWTAWMVFTFYQVVSQGLISVPDMTVTGNHSTQDLLIWTQDRSPGILPSPWVAIYSAHTYHLLMLFWSLWLSVQLLPWSRFAVAALKSDTWFRPFLFAHGRRKIKK